MFLVGGVGKGALECLNFEILTGSPFHPLVAVSKAVFQVAVLRAWFCTCVNDIVQALVLGSPRCNLLMNVVIPHDYPSFEASESDSLRILS